MKIAYVSTYDSTNVRSWSGTGYFIPKALEQQSIEVIRIGPLREHSDRLIRVKRRFYKRFTGMKFLPERHPRVLRAYARQVAERLKGLDVDAIFSPGTIPICHLESSRPIVFWTDASCASMLGFYPNWMNISRETVRHCHAMEQAALSNSRLAIYSSDWAVETTTRAYDVDAAKVRMVPFGANIETGRNLDDVRTIVAARRPDVCRLLFLGVEWHRKGGDIAVETARRLNELGLKTELTIAGCEVPIEIPDYVSARGFISKSTPEGRAEIDRLLAESHFLLLPTRADCVPIVIAEANSYGIPVVTSNVGGIPTAIRNGVNGAALELADFPARACAFILESTASQPAYRNLGLSSFGEYETRLNWQAAGRQVKALLQEIL